MEWIIGIGVWAIVLVLWARSEQAGQHHVLRGEQLGKIEDHLIGIESRLHIIESRIISATEAPPLILEM